MFSYETVVEAIDDLKNRGFEKDLNYAFDINICVKVSDYLQPEDFHIVETYRFEGQTNPSDEDIVYAMISKDGNIKGVFTGAFGLYDDGHSIEVMRTIEAKGH